MQDTVGGMAGGAAISLGAAGIVADRDRRTSVVPPVWLSGARPRRGALLGMVTAARLELLQQGAVRGLSHCCIDRTWRRHRAVRSPASRRPIRWHDDTCLSTC